MREREREREKKKKKKKKKKGLLKDVETNVFFFSFKIPLLTFQSESCEMFFHEVESAEDGKRKRGRLADGSE